MDASHQYKLDPRLRRLARQRVAAGKKRRDRFEQVFVEVANAEAAKWVADQRWVKKLVQLVDGYYTARVARNRLSALAAAEGVIEVEAVRYLRPHLDRSLRSIHGRDEPIKGGGLPDGRGVVIGIVDYGLDVTQKDFQNPPRAKIRDAHNPRGITRVAYLWDQALTRKGRERAPEKYRYGVEYSSKEIDRALRTKPALIRHNPLGAKDIPGHGTHVAGIAAGNGTTADRKFLAEEYEGVAPGATLVFVNLRRGAIVRQVQAPGGTLANSINIAHGVAYCFEKADELGMPCVVNLSLGCNGGGHDGNMALEWIIDALLQKSGRAVVIAAGNEDGAKRPMHATGSLKQGEKAALEWEIGSTDDPNPKNDPNSNELEVWYPRGCAIKVSLVAPGEEQETSHEVLLGESRTFRFAAGEKVSIDSDAATPWNGAARIHIELRGPQNKGIRFGTWTVKLKAIHVAPKEPRRRVRFDAWIERTLPARAGRPEEHSRFKHYDSNTAINVTTPSTARRAITVASYANDGSPRPAISGFSSRGPTRDGRFKPELAAPGDPIFSTNARAGNSDNGGVRPARVPSSGTSMAAPHVAGVVARMLSRNAYLTAEEIGAILIKSAIEPGRGARWNSKWGYGKLHAARAVELVAQLLGSRRTAS